MKLNALIRVCYWLLQTQDARGDYMISISYSHIWLLHTWNATDEDQLLKHFIGL